jgi:hypothetical protein
MTRHFIVALLCAMLLSGCMATSPEQWSRSPDDARVHGGARVEGERGASRAERRKDKGGVVVWATERPFSDPARSSATCPGPDTNGSDSPS